MDAPDKNSSARQAWIREEQADRKRLGMAGLGITLLLCMMLVLSVVAWSTSAQSGECDGFGLELGVGVHARGWDAPEYTTLNPLGIVELSYRNGRARFVLSHASSMEGFPRVFDSPSEDGYGANVASVRWALW